jgi:hypothetical protein
MIYNAINSVDMIISTQVLKLHPEALTLPPKSEIQTEFIRADFEALE